MAGQERRAEIVGGVVKNVILVDPADAPEWAADWPVVADDIGIGWEEDGQGGLAAPATDLAAERARMVVSPAQMRLALHRAGLLDAVTQIAAADAEASIVWEYATEIQRTSPLIDTLKTNAIQNFTDAEIDAIFASAMAI